MSTFPRAPRPVIAGNWKMHQGPRAAREFVRTFLDAVEPDGQGSIVIFPPAVSLTAAVEEMHGREDIQLGVQNVYWEEKGAFTGEISAPLAAEAGARFVLVGHSERRHVFGETDGETARKTKACFDAGLTPVLCVGETLEEREAGAAADVVKRQLSAVCDGISGDRLASIVIAYEPVWAIGTGRTASPSDAAQMHGEIRAFLREIAGADVADRIPILYGGSVKPDNTADLLAADQVDGVLVGGASLDAGSFAAICRAAG